MKKINLAFGIHNHQPVGNFDFVIEEAYEKSYLPFLELLEQHPQVRLAQHFTGILFEWIKEHRPEFIRRLRVLVEAGQVEMMTGGYYEPVLAVIPDRDKLGQIRKLSEFVRSETGYDPQGMWLAERIWEPHLPKPCAEAGVKYLVLDDSHFKNTGLTDDQLTGYFVTEEQGHRVFLFPIAEKLRYTIPFRPPEETIEYLKSRATEDGEALVVFADDGEKFGVWPGTYEHCYEEFWLERFFEELEKNRDWIHIMHLSEALQRLKPLGMVYLPAASYREMMEWAMPTDAIHLYESFEETLKQKDLFEAYKVFVRSGYWRNFMVKYPEANNLHKKMLRVSRRVGELARLHSGNPDIREAQDHLWAGQCNCPYWHGVFGGLYLNHLRFAAYHELIRAETCVDRVTRSAEEHENGWLESYETDFDCDGFDELLISNRSLNLYLSPHHGGSIFELDYKPQGINLLDTMTRRPEAYHKKLTGAPGANEDHSSGDGLASIHEIVQMKEEGLENKLFYDAYRRSMLLDHFLDDHTSVADFARARYEEMGDFLDASYDCDLIQEPEELEVRLSRQGQVRVAHSIVPVFLAKTITLQRAPAHMQIHYSIKNLDTSQQAFWFAIEMGLSLLAGDAPDRYYVVSGGQLADRRLNSTGESQNVRSVQLRDEWLKIAPTLALDKAATLWRSPIETVSQSEAGYERVYQSSVLLPNWKFVLQPGESWEVGLTLEIQPIP